MTRQQEIHQERKEHWRRLIRECEASGMLQQDWCKAHQVCCASLSRWRTQIWREEEAEKEFALMRASHKEERMESISSSEGRLEETSFVEMNAVLTKADDKTGFYSGEQDSGIDKGRVSISQKDRSRGEIPKILTPDAVIGYRDYMVGVYEHTSSQVLHKVMEVLQYA